MAERAFAALHSDKGGYAKPLNSRDRYLTTFRHEEPDRVPIFMNTSQFYFVDDRIRWRDQFEGEGT